MRVEGWTAVAVVALLSGLTAGAQAQDAVVSLRGPVAGLDVTGGAANPEGTAVQGQADFQVRLPTLQGRVRSTVNTGSQDTGATSGGRVEMESIWSDTGLPTVQIQASSEQQNQLQGRSRTETDASTARTAVLLKPLDIADVEIGAETERRTETASVRADRNGTSQRTIYEANRQNVFATVKVPVLPSLNVEAGADLGVANAGWRGQGAAAAAHDAVQPRVSATYTPWSSTVIDAGVERKASLPNAAELAALAQPGMPAGSTVNQASEWEYRARASQTLGPATIETAYTYAHGNVGATGIVSGSRSQVDVAASVPLRGAGLPDTTLVSKSTWRESGVYDPALGGTRRISGELPVETQVHVVQDVPAWDAKIGLGWQNGGTATTYRPDQISTISSGDTVSAFVERELGGNGLTLRLDGTYGGTDSNTNVYYRGSRSSGAIDRIEQRSQDDARVNVSVRRAF